MVRAAGGSPFLLDSPRPRIPLAEYRAQELRFRTLANTDPAEAERLLALAQQAADERWRWPYRPALTRPPMSARAMSARCGPPTAAAAPGSLAGRTYRA